MAVIAVTEQQISLSAAYRIRARVIERFGDPVYKRIDAAANTAQKNVLKNLSPEAVKAETLAGSVRPTGRSWLLPSSSASSGPTRTETSPRTTMPRGLTRPR